MDLALRYRPELDAFDLRVDALSADLAQEDTLVSAVLLSLMCDRTAQPGELPAGNDRRGWWADAFAQDGDRFGSRLWLLQRLKQIPESLQRVRAYIEEALAWLIADGFASRIEVAVFTPRIGWVVAEIVLHLNGESRRYRFEWNQDAQEWRLAGELH